MKEIVKEALRGKAIFIGDIGERFREIVESNHSILKSVHANLAECNIEVETNKEHFKLLYFSFNPVNQSFYFR